MQSVVKSSVKSVEQYRHNIKLLKYHLKKEQKVNETLRYREAKKARKDTVVKGVEKAHDFYGMVRTVNGLNQRLKEMGLVLGDVFRMADGDYEGEITKEQFMRTVVRLRANLEEQLINEMFYAIDTNLNGMLSADQYDEFLYAHGGSESKEAASFQRKTAEKLAAILKKKGIKLSEWLKENLDPCGVEQLAIKLKDLKMNANQNMTLMKMWDPSLSGSVRHEVYLKSMENVKQKDEKQIQNQKFEKGIKELCVLFRERKLNPIALFQDSEADGKPGINSIQLEDGLKKLIPQQTAFQIRKWVNLINLNGDNEITKEQFISAIRSFYSIQQISNFSNQYEKLHPSLTKALNQQEIPAQKIINQLSIAIQDRALTKTQVFHKIDINHNGLIDKEELLNGLKNMGIHVGLIAKVLTVFDRDASGEVSVDQWLNILGQDVEMEDVDIPKPTPKKDTKKPVKAQTKKVAKPQPKKKQASPQPKKKQASPQPKKPEVQQSKKKVVQPKKVVEPKKEEVKPDIKKSKQPIQKKEPIQVDNKEIKSSSVNKTVAKKNEPSKDQDKNKTVQDIKKSGPSAPSVSKKGGKAPIKAQKPAYAEDQMIKIKKDTLKSKQVFKQAVSQNQQDNDVHNKDDDIIEEDHNEKSIEQIQKQVAEKYAKSKKNVLNIFESGSKNSKKGLSESQLQKCIKLLKLDSQMDQDQLKMIFQGNVSSNGKFQYQEWLASLLQKFGIQQEPQQEKQQEEVQQAGKEASQHQDEKHDLPNESNVDYQQSFENESKVRDNKQKRGEELEQFKQVKDIVTQNQTHTEQGYKFSAYIGNEEQMDLLTKKYLPNSNKIKASKKKFKDTSFPAELSSLTDKSPADSKIQSVSLLKWKHYSQIYSNPKLFDKGIDPNDIRQGQLGDCYFLCSLAGLAQYNKLIERIFEYYDIQNGYFLVWLCFNGKWKLIQLDGYIPVKPDGKRLVFSHGKDEDQQLWVLLLQKAYAKAYGCYEHIVGGQPYEAIKDLTGAPGQSFNHKNKNMNPEILWQKLGYANKEKFLMTCGTDKSNQAQFKYEDKAESVTTEGIVIGHAYSILDVAEYRGQKLIQLRNPWGTMQWKGQWSDNSNKWTPEAKKTLKFSEAKDDGVFWIPYQKFYNYYATTAINYIRPTYYYTSEQKTKVKNLLVKIESSSLKHGFIMVAQKDHRQQGLVENTPYNVCHIIAINYKNEKVLKTISDEKYMYQREGSVELADIQQNSEVIILINLEKSSDINLCTYANTKLNYQVDDSFENMLQYIEKIAEVQQSAKNVQSNKDKTYKSWMACVGEYCFFVFKNTSKNQLNLTVQLKKPSNLKLLQNTNNYKMSIKPGYCDSIKGKIIDLSQSYGFGPMFIGQ